MGTVKERAVVIKQEAKNILEVLDNFKGLDSMWVIENSLKLIQSETEEGIKQIQKLQTEWKEGK